MFKTQFADVLQDLDQNQVHNVYNLFKSDFLIIKFLQAEKLPELKQCLFELQD